MGTFFVFKVINGLKIRYNHCMYSKIKFSTNENQSKTIENEIKQNYNQNFNNFLIKCRVEKNDLYICAFIRQNQ